MWENNPGAQAQAAGVGPWAANVTWDPNSACESFIEISNSR
jgi:hypothetical protein